MKQTAVEWLIEQLPNGDFDYQKIVIAQAIEMENKQQDELAIGFAEWILINNFEMRNDNHENWWGKFNEEKDYTSKELLEIYKNETKR